MEARHAFIQQQAERDSPVMTQTAQSSRPPSVDLIDLSSECDEEPSSGPVEDSDEVTHVTVATLDLPAHSRTPVLRGNR